MWTEKAQLCFYSLELEGIFQWLQILYENPSILLILNHGQGQRVSGTYPTAKGESATWTAHQSIAGPQRWTTTNTWGNIQVLSAELV